MSDPIPCPDRKTLKALLQGQLAEEELDQIAPHLESCAVCSAAMESLNTTTGLGRSLDRAQTAGPLEKSVLPLLEGMLETCEEPGALGRLGTWLVYEVIDRGGMGIVLRGKDPALRREVAIKLLGPDLATDAECRERFLREAQAAAAVDHEHVIPVYAVCEDAALPYLVMAYNEGETLQQRLDREGRLSFEEALRIGRAVAAGLAAAHAQGLVHRDVKPGNILLSKDGKVRLADFGLAQTADNTRLTRSGSVAGTPGYMAPEQLDGAALDGRTDLFALGGIIYRMLTGKGPFDAPTVVAVMKRVALDDPPPIKEVADPPPPDWFCTLTEELLEKNPEARPSTAAEVVERMDGKPSPAEAHRKRRSLKVAVLGATVCIAASGWLAHRHFSKPDGPPPSALELDLRLAAERAKTGASAERIAWLAAALDKAPGHTGAERMLLHELVYAREPVAIAHGGPAFPLTLDAGTPIEWVRFGSEGKDIFAETTQGLIHAWNARNGQLLLSKFSWPGDARVLTSTETLTIFATPDQQIWAINHHQFSFKTRLANTLPLAQVCISEGASVLLTGATDGRVEAWDLETSQVQHRLPRHTATITHLLITTNRATAVSAAEDGSVHILDLYAGTQRGPTLQHDGSITWAAFSPDNALLATGSADGTARVWDVATATPVTPFLRHGGSCPPGEGIIGVFLDDQRLVTAGTDDGLAHIWDARSGSPAHESLAHAGWVTALAAHPGEFASADSTGTVRLWDAARAEPVSPPLPHSTAITMLEYAPGHQQLLVGGPGGTAWVYDLAPLTPDLPAWFPSFAEEVAARHINARGVAEALPVADEESLRNLWSDSLTPDEDAKAVRVAEWLIAPAEERSRQPFAVPPPMDSKAVNTVREFLFRQFRAQVEAEMQSQPDE